MNFFDLHCDTAYEYFFKNIDFGNRVTAINSESAVCLDKWTQIFAVWIRDDIDEPYRLYRAVLDGFKSKLVSSPDNLTPLFAVEGGAVIGKDIDLLCTLKADGIKYLTLTWNGENLIAGGSRSEKGLTRFGKEVIRKLNELKICTDLSHLNDKSFFSALSCAEYPIASHSNSRAVCDVPRNLTDEQLKEIAAAGGIVGLCFYPPFLGDNVSEGLFRNIAHMLDIGLEDSICIGSDFDGGEMSDSLKDPQSLPDAVMMLENRGVNKNTLDKIFYGNAQKYFDKLSSL